MRDINRIDDFMNQIAEIWKKYFPDWRFGQLMVNFMSEYGDPFYMEEDRFMEKFVEFAQKYGPKSV